jgi:SAM-dependent methyltransferase
MPQQPLDPYENIAHIYSGDSQAEDDPEMRAKTRAQFVALLQGRRILEIGCGPGIDSKTFLDSGLQVIASDRCVEFLSIVQARYPHLDTCAMDMTAPCFAANTFDGIFGFASFIHLPRNLAEHTLFGLRKILRQHGVLYLTLISSSKYTEYTLSNWGGLKGNSALFTCYSEFEMLDLMQQTGFVDLNVFHIPSKLYDSLPRLVERGVTGFHISGRCHDSRKKDG